MATMAARQEEIGESGQRKRKEPEVLEVLGGTVLAPSPIRHIPVHLKLLLYLSQ